MISVIIATKNRPLSLSQSVESIFNNTYRNIEVLIIDQSTLKRTGSAVSRDSNKNIIYIPHNRVGKAAALNEGVSRAKGTVVAFTDDDCVLDKKWLSTIEKTFKQNKKIDGVFGKTLSYKPGINKKKFCPSTFNKNVRSIITTPCFHAKHIGFGNNMAIRTSIFKKLGGFKPWLGPGSIGSNAEDAEMALRMLTYGYKILYNPDLIVYHNRWLDENELRKQQLSYTCGEVACYGYYHFQGYQFAGHVVKFNIRDSYYKLGRIIRYIITFRKSKTLLIDIFYWFMELSYRIRGFAVAALFSLIDPVR